MLKIEYLPVNKLKPYKRNARKHAARDIAAIKKSIEKYGMNDAIGIWSDDNVIVEGHGRWLACCELGVDEVPCVRLDHLSDKERREYAIAHNATAELSEWDDILAEEIADLDLSEFDFDFLAAEVEGGGGKRGRRGGRKPDRQAAGQPRFSFFRFRLWNKIGMLCRGCVKPGGSGAFAFAA